MGRKLVPIFVWSAAAVLIALGLLTVWLPIPTGVPLIAGGAFLILGTSRQAVRWLRARRRRPKVWQEQTLPVQTDNAVSG